MRDLHHRPDAGEIAERGQEGDVGLEQPQRAHGVSHAVDRGHGGVERAAQLLEALLGRGGERREQARGVALGEAPEIGRGAERAHQQVPHGRLGDVAPEGSEVCLLAAAALDLRQHALRALAVVEHGRGGDAGMERRLGHAVGRNSRRRIAPQSCDWRNTPLGAIAPYGTTPRRSCRGRPRCGRWRRWSRPALRPRGPWLAARRACSTASAKCTRGSSPASIGSTTRSMMRGPVGEAALVGVGIAAHQAGGRHHLARGGGIDGERALDEVEPARDPRLLLGKAQRARAPAPQAREHLEAQEAREARGA